MHQCVHPERDLGRGSLDVKRRALGTRLSKSLEGPIFVKSGFWETTLQSHTLFVFLVSGFRWTSISLAFDTEFIGRQSIKNQSPITSQMFGIVAVFNVQSAAAHTVRVGEDESDSQAGKSQIPN